MKFINIATIKKHWKKQLPAGAVIEAKWIDPRPVKTRKTTKGFPDLQRIAEAKVHADGYKSKTFILEVRATMHRDGYHYNYIAY